MIIQIKKNYFFEKNAQDETKQFFTKLSHKLKKLKQLLVSCYSGS